MSNSKYIPIILTLILILSSITIINAEETPPQTIYVSISGNDTFDGLTPETSKRTVQNAVDKAIDGSIIQVGPGIYEENIVVNKSLELVAEDPTQTIINGNKKSTCITIKKRCKVILKGSP